MIRRSALLVLLLLSMLAAPSFPRGAVAGPAGAITLYTSESDDDVNALTQDFTRRTGVRVNVFRAGSGPVVSRIQAEMQVGRIQADVIWFADIAFFQDLAKRNLLATYVPPAGRRVSSQLKYDGNRYHEVRLILNVVGFNTRTVRFRPTSWTDFTLPRYRNMVGMPSPFVSGAALAHVATFASMREFGWDYYRKLRQNNAQVLRSNGDVIQKLASGEVAVVQIVDFFVRAAKLAGSPVDHIWPAEGALLVPTPVAILRDSGNPEAAQAFVNYLLTPEAQQIFVQRSYIPVVPGIKYPAGVPELEQLKIMQPNLTYLERNREDVRRTFGEIFNLQ